MSDPTFSLALIVTIVALVFTGMVLAAGAVEAYRARQTKARRTVRIQDIEAQRAALRRKHTQMYGPVYAETYDGHIAQAMDLGNER